MKLFPTICFLFMSTGILLATEEAKSLSPLETADKALQKGADYLLSVQNEDGSFGENPVPAVTALCAIALADVKMDTARRDAATEKAMKNVMSYVKEDGSVHGKPGRHFIFFSDAGYPNYTTAVSLLAMHTFRKPEYIPIMKAAREYLKAVQIEDTESKHFGGFTYGKGGKADISNTSWSAEALHYTEYLDKEPYVKQGEKSKKSNEEMWSAIDAFLKKAQNMPNPTDEDKKDLDGGFGYRPETLVSSGSMTYSGLKSMVYAKLRQDDPRVKAVLDFVKKNYTVDRNPGQELKGHFYYLQTMAKALDALGHVKLQSIDGKEIKWREDIIKKVSDMQLSFGAWFNSNGRYMESNKELVTAYAMISLKFAAKGLRN